MEEFQELAVCLAVRPVALCPVLRCFCVIVNRVQPVDDCAEIRHQSACCRLRGSAHLAGTFDENNVLKAVEPAVQSSCFVPEAAGGLAALFAFLRRVACFDASKFDARIAQRSVYWMTAFGEGQVGTRA
ncbi:hypothetical protein ACIA74_41040 [Streptomyces sp. NPDC051658]|uniref:hypothetical protein n=1 Tax=Streptomyces sp. NPDC051658 TaxID=3365667 RepID=UPI003791571F